MGSFLLQMTSSSWLFRELDIARGFYHSIVKNGSHKILGSSDESFFLLFSLYSHKI